RCRRISAGRGSGSRPWLAPPAAGYGWKCFWNRAAGHCPGRGKRGGDRGIPCWAFAKKCAFYPHPARPASSSNSRESGLVTPLLMLTQNGLLILFEHQQLLVSADAEDFQFGNLLLHFLDLQQLFAAGYGSAGGINDGFFRRTDIALQPRDGFAVTRQRRRSSRDTLA